MTSAILINLIRKQKILNKNFCVLFSNFIRNSSDKFDKSSAISSSTILMQDGIEVRELPVIVKKVKNILQPVDGKIECVNEYSTKFTDSESSIHEIINKEFSICKRLDEVLLLLAKCSTITPNIALGAIERIYSIYESNVNNENEKYDISVLSDTNILDRLLKIIVKSEDIYSLLRALKCISRKNDKYLDAVCDEILDRVTDNKLSIHQMCDVILFFGSNKQIDKFSENIDKMWTGFIERDREMNQKNIVEIFNILHYLNASRKVIFGILEKKLITLWWQMEPDNIIEIMNALQKNNITSTKMFPVLGRWINTNIHVLSEDQLMQLVTKFIQLKYNDSQIEKALERYIKLKGLKITNHVLMVTVMNYFTHFRIRNHHVLNGCAEYFIVNGKNLEPIFIKPLIYPFGYLNYHPENGIKFWKEVEEVIHAKFLRINTEDLIDTLLSCVYLQKYPLNFVSKLFNPKFLERINSSQNPNLLRSKLKLLDTALTLECNTYKGPILPKDLNSKSFSSDGRIRRIVNHIRSTFEVVAGGSECFSTSVVLPKVYTTDIYIVDILLHPKNLKNSLLNSVFYSDRNINTAVLVSIPEHFCTNSEIYLGLQDMRIRHMRIMGLKVVTLKYEILSRLKVHVMELEKYIISRIKAAQNAIPNSEVKQY